MVIIIDLQKLLRFLVKAKAKWSLLLAHFLIVVAASNSQALSSRGKLVTAMPAPKYLIIQVGTSVTNFGCGRFQCGKWHILSHLQVIVSLEADEGKAFNDVLLVERLLQSFSDFLSRRPRRLYLDHVLILVVLCKCFQQIFICSFYYSGPPQMFCSPLPL